MFINIVLISNYFKYNVYVTFNSHRVINICICYTYHTKYFIDKLLT